MKMWYNLFMKIRILSDLHLDVNDNYCFKIPEEQQDVFTVIAGDTSGDPDMTIDWLKKNVKRGVFISGNHLVYNGKEKTIQELREQLASAFPKDADITYLDNEVGVISKEVDGVLFVGSCLYTDFKLPCTWRGKACNDQQINMSTSWRTMNDYRWGIKEHSADSISKDVYITPEDYLEWFEKAFTTIQDLVEANERLADPKPIVIVTHHAPLKDCISGYYVNDDANASYASDLEWFIKKHPSIKCWIYGHIHNDQKEIDVLRDDGTKCIVINNARGYCPRVEDRNFNANTFIDTDTWKVEKTPFSKSHEDKVKKRSDEYLKAMAPFIF